MNNETFEAMRNIYQRKLAAMDSDEILCEEQQIRINILKLRKDLMRQEILLKDVEKRLEYLGGFTPEKIIERSTL